MTANTADKEAVLNKIDEMFQCYQTGDLDLVMRCHDNHPDISAIGTNKEQFLIGTKLIREEYERDLETFQNARLERTAQHVSILADVAVCAVAYRVYLDEESDESTPMRLSAVLIKRGDDWLIHHTHLSVSLEDAAPEPDHSEAVTM